MSPTSRPRTISSRRPSSLQERSSTATRRPAVCGAEGRDRREALRDSGYEVDAVAILVTNGGKQAIYGAFAAILDPGDEVIVPAVLDDVPRVDPPRGRRAGGRRGRRGRPLPRLRSSGWRAARTERIERSLLFVSPPNPTRRRASGGRRRGDRPLGRGARSVGHDGRDLRAPLVYGDAKFTPLPAILPELRWQVLHRS